MTDDERKNFINKWNADNKNLPWQIVFAPKMSEEAYRQHFTKQSPEVEHHHPQPPTGRIIYSPHNCDLPDSWNTPIGTIWECLGHREGRLCYDQWIVVAKRGARFWELFKRNI